jgi:TPR repeat protein
MKSYHYLQIVVLAIFCLVSPLDLQATTFHSAAKAYEAKEYDSAIKQFTDLAYQNNEYAQYVLGKIYANGEGVRRDDVRAYSWLLLAEQNGHEMAAALKDKIGRTLSQGQINRARQLSEQVEHAINTRSGPSEITDPAVVREVQRVLTEKGYYLDRIDGRAGERTRQAISTYQKTIGWFPRDGKITEELLSRMRIAAPFTDNKPRWSSDNKEQELKQIKKKLRRIIHRAKKDKAAEPWLINRLEQLVSEETASRRPYIIFREELAEVDYSRGEKR